MESGTYVFGSSVPRRPSAARRPDTSASLFEKQTCTNPGPTSVKPNYAVLATSENVPDALSATYVAGALNTSMIVTPTAAVAQATLRALRLEGGTGVIVVGGPLAISHADTATLRATPAYFCGGLYATGSDLTVTRIAGQTPYGTAEDVAESTAISEAATPGSLNVPGAYGSMYDGITGSNGTTAANAVTDVPTAIVNLGIQQVIVMGGPLAVSNNVVSQLMGLGVSTFRIAGIDATDTAQLLAEFELNATNASSVADGLAWTPADALIVSRGDYYTDAVSAAALAGIAAPPIVLAENPATVGQHLIKFLNTAGTVGYNNGTTSTGPKTPAHVHSYQVVDGPPSGHRTGGDDHDQQRPGSQSQLSACDHRSTAVPTCRQPGDDTGTTREYPATLLSSCARGPVARRRTPRVGSPWRVSMMRI